MTEERRVDQREQSRWRRTIGQLLRRRPTRTQLLWAGGIAALAFLVVVICGYLFGWKWTGLPDRTLWDWLGLLIVPVVLALGGYLFARSEDRRSQDLADHHAQENALQAYLDQMGLQLLEGAGNLSQPQLEAPDEARIVARARTLTVLTRLDGGRKGSVVRFLYEAKLISAEGSSVINLKEANLHQVDLRDVNLQAVNLYGADLRSALLSGANLSGANLRDVLLTEANLRDTNLYGAIFKRR